MIEIDCLAWRTKIGGEVRVMSAHSSKRRQSGHRAKFGLGQNRSGRVVHLLFLKGFATSRALSMKSRATGLSARFLTVMIVTGRRGFGIATGNTL